MKKLALFVIIMTIILLNGQEIYTISDDGSGDYDSFSDAVDYLNDLTELPEAGIIFNVSADDVFNEVPDTIMVSATESNPVIFQKSGIGENPLLVNIVDTTTIIQFHEASWVTFNGIDIGDTNTADSLYYDNGYFIDSSSNISIIDCRIFNFNIAGISVIGASENTIIEHNEVFYTEDFTTTENTIDGIKVAFDILSDGVSIFNNRIWGLKGATTAIHAIDIDQVTGICANNFISTANDNNEKIYGIKAAARTGRSIELLHNTVYLSGAAADEGYSLALMGSGGNLTVRNNIAVNNRTDSLQYNIFISSIFEGIVLDNNVYYNADSTGFKGKLNQDIFDDLPLWQDASGMDLQSVITEVEFADANNGDLHISGNSLGDMQLAVESVGISFDIDYESRPEEHLYCGADENTDYLLLITMNPEYTIDAEGNGDFSSFTDAAALINNSQVPAGGTIFYVNAGQNFAEGAVSFTGLADEDSPIIFQKAGTGENPRIINNENIENIIEFNNASYITFNGIDIADPLPDDTFRYQTGFSIIESNMLTIKNCCITDFDEYGIRITDSSSYITIENDTLSYSDEYFTSQNCVNAVSVQCNGLADSIVIRNNHIHSIKSGVESLYGIRLAGANTHVYNNFISLTSDNNSLVYGLGIENLYQGLQTDISFNSVLLGGIAADSSSCFYRTGSDGLLNIYDNIFINNRSGEFAHLIYDIDDGSGNWNADYNAYNTESGRLGNWGETICETILDWQAATGADSNSVYTNVQFISDTDLHLTGISLGDYTLAGIQVPGIDTDIDGEIRLEVNPYMGADENIEYPLTADSQYVISVTPEELNFGSYYVGEISDTHSVSIRNDGADILTIFEITAPDNYLISDNQQTWIDSIGEFNILQGDSVEISVIFIPEETGYQFGDLDIHSNAIENEHEIVNLIALAIEPLISIVPDSIDFSLTSTGIVSDPKFLTVHNENSIPLTLNEINVSENFAIKIGSQCFNQLNNIALGDSLSFEVVFVPQQSGQLTGELSIYSELIHGAEAGETIALSGEAFDFRFTVIEQEFLPLNKSDSKWGDFNNDGYLDILSSGYQLDSDYGQMHIYQNNGDSTFTELVHFLPGIADGTVEWIDFDNDADLDIFIMGQYESDTYIAKTYRNDDGEFIEIENEIDALKSCDSDVGDYDADGDYDLLLMGDQFVPEGDDIPHLRLYSNNGNGIFTFITEIDSISNGEAEFGDYDNDGDLDIALCGKYDSSNYAAKIFRNDDNIHFTDLESEFTDLCYSVIEWGDHDNDGDLDLMVSGSCGNQFDSELHIYENLGNDMFTDSGADIPGIYQGDIVHGDLDQDGDLDVIVNGIHNYSSWIGYIYLNQGDFYYTLVDSVESLKYADMVLGDVDNDNDLDLFVTGRYGYMDYRVMLYENEVVFSNSVPDPPEAFEAIVEQDSVIFSWNPASDDLTPDEGLNYNICIGTESGLDNFLPPLADLDTGFRKIAEIGNAGQNLNYTIHNLPIGTYYACVQSIDTSYKGSVFSEEISFEITWSEENENSIPKVTELKNNYPNPFNPETVIQFTIADESEVNLDIYNIKGQKVKTLVSDRLVPDSYTVIWNGTDSYGKKSASGIYLYKLHTEKYQKIKKMTLIK